MELNKLACQMDARIQVNFTLAFKKPVHRTAMQLMRPSSINNPKVIHLNHSKPWDGIRMG
jgi:hypothetical protein